ncbi:GLOBIN domain-containing protein [Trichonephila clavipes]|nr:GLOBIN domain-containing protein [Trichonephila clavipes]
MGCTFAKTSKSGSAQDLNHAGEAPGAPPAQDPRIPLTVRQKFSISKSWKAIARAMDQTGVAMFVNTGTWLSHFGRVVETTNDRFSAVESKRPATQDD